MSDFDRNAQVWGAGRAQQTSAAELDQGLRSFMLGVYNNMTIGLAITGLMAIGISMLAIAGYSPSGKVTALTPLGQALYLSPLKWVVMLAPLAFILFFSFKAESMETVLGPCHVLRLRGGDGHLAVVDLRRLHRRVDRQGVLHHLGGLRRP